MSTHQLYICSLLLLTSSAAVFAKTTTIFGASPNGGLWSSDLDTSGNGEATNSPNSGFTTLTQPIGVSSYDPISKQVLLELYDPHSLAYAPVCSNNNNAEPKVISTLELGPVTDPMYGDCLGCTATGYTMYDSKIYFLLTGTYMSSGMITRKAQIRVLDSCDTCLPEPGSGDAGFSAVVNCSTHVADALYQSFSMEDIDDAEILPGKVMKLVQHGDKKSFFLQLLNVTGSEEDDQSRVSMTLYHVTEDGTSTSLHSAQVDARFKSGHIRSLGGVDYQDGFLCWTFGDRMYCGSYDIETKQLTNVERYMWPGEAVAFSVCTGTDLSVLSVITGIAIVDSGEKSLVFGCYPQSTESGGAGFIQALRGAANKDISPLRTPKDEMLKAGSIFTVDSLPTTCSFDPKPTFCIPPSPFKSTAEPEDEPTPSEETTPEEEAGTSEGEPEGETDNEIEIQPEYEDKTEENGENEIDKEAAAGDNGARTLAHSLLSLLSVLVLGLYV